MENIDKIDTKKLAEDFGLTEEDINSLITSELELEPKETEKTIKNVIKVAEPKTKSIDKLSSAGDTIENTSVDDVFEDLNSLRSDKSGINVATLQKQLAQKRIMELKSEAAQSDEKISPKVKDTTIKTEEVFIESDKPSDTAKADNDVDFKGMFSEIYKRKQQMSKEIVLSDDILEEKLTETKAVKIPKPAKIRRTLENSTECVQQANFILNNLEKNVRKYFRMIEYKRNKNYLDYVDHIEIAKDISIPMVLSLRNRKKEFETLITPFNCPLYADIKFKKYELNSVRLELYIPDLMLGADLNLPEMVISTIVPSKWGGNAALVWQPVTNSYEKWGFYPFVDSSRINQNVTLNYKERLIDAFCDYFNNYNTDLTKPIKKFIKKYITKESLRKYWKYISHYDRHRMNTIIAPIRCEYIGDFKCKLSFRFYAVGETGEALEWPNLSNIIKNCLIPLAKAVYYFSGGGEVDKRLEIDYIQQQASKLPKKK